MRSFGPSYSFLFYYSFVLLLTIITGIKSVYLCACVCVHTYMLMHTYIKILPMPRQWENFIPYKEVSSESLFQWSLHVVKIKVFIAEEGTKSLLWFVLCFLCCRYLVFSKSSRAVLKHPSCRAGGGNAASLLHWWFLRILQSFLIVVLGFYSFHSFIHLEVGSGK